MPPDAEPQLSESSPLSLLEPAQGAAPLPADLPPDDAAARVGTVPEPEVSASESPMVGPPDAGASPVSVRYAGGAASGGRAGVHLVTAKNRWSRVIAGFQDLPSGIWCSLHLSLAWDAEEEAGSALDFALAGFDFLTEDGSSLDLEHVPGLARTSLDPYSTAIAGPWLRPGSARTARAIGLSVGFRVPDMARGLSVTLRSWRNTRPFVLSDIVLRPGLDAPSEPETAAGRPRRRPLGPQALTLRHGLVPGMGLVLRGQLYAARADQHAACVHLVYRDARGAVITPPYPGSIFVPALGAMINLAAHRQARRFTLDLEPPPEAAAIELGFGTWGDAGAPEVELVAAPEIALDEIGRAHV